jgi:hypothetical protein
MLKVAVCVSPAESVPVIVTELTPVDRGGLQEKLVEVSLAATSSHVTAIGSMPEIEPATDPVIVAYGVVIVAPFDGAEIVRPVIVSGGPTVKVFELLDASETVTAIGPVVAPTGTVATMVMLFQLVGVADTPLNVTVPPPCVVPKPLPYMVIKSPTAPKSDDSPVTMHPETVNVAGLLCIPPTVTTIFPVVALLGKFMLMELLPHPVTPAGIPLSVTVLAP